MPYNPEIHHRQSIRLKNYGYSKEGLYFITICTHNREKLFGEIVNVGAHCMCPDPQNNSNPHCMCPNELNVKMILSEYGKIAEFRK